MPIQRFVDLILGEYRRNGGELPDSDWQAIAQLTTEMIPPFPNIPGPVWIPIMSRNVPAGVELVIVKGGKVLLTKREFCGQVAYHTPGTYIAPL